VLGGGLIGDFWVYVCFFGVQRAWYNGPGWGGGGDALWRCGAGEQARLRADAPGEVFSLCLSPIRRWLVFISVFVLDNPPQSSSAVV
jgi:hypothetical protein